ncbi:hypothetical protein ONE63_005424 [Megalurothrips usitatus]|uniref:Uncharacterized protein n=1 Tax=Megalurothrips usitatus TaxID=439358 RepID=A0AAV7XYX0_9NEOP|nr:hypothetical protein ONE63_005424 [Megalurothrips usitatus]
MGLRLQPGLRTALAALAVLSVALRGAAADQGPPKVTFKLPEVRPTTALIGKFGYPAEGHYVETDDGYVLRLDRVARPGADVVLLGNPLTCNSACYCMLERESLAFKMFDAGFDVWLGNFRGNGLSKNHTRFSVNDGRFWDFSWHEHGTLDVPAMVDYIVSATGRETLLYAGHSMGSTALLVTAALRPRTATRIRAAFLMGPAAYMGNHDTPSLYAAHALLQETEVGRARRPRAPAVPAPVK